jgi:hypothetical protein
MTIQVNDRATHSRPTNRSIEAYKAWITEIAHRLTTEQTAIQFTEAEWIVHWKEYWKEISSRLEIH